MRYALIGLLLNCMSVTATYGRERHMVVSADSMYVDPYIERFISLYKADILRTKRTHKQLVAFIEDQLRISDMPLQLRNLAIIESALNNQTISWAGAAGCWQLMPEESRTHGLVVDSVNDERYDILKSTHVAILLLKELYTKYNDWLLVIAAYNCGAGRLDRAIKQTGEFDFWKIQDFLPQETRNHVKKFIAVGNVLDGSQLLSDRKESKNFVVRSVDSIWVSSTFQLKVIARFLQIQEDKLINLNKDFEQVRRDKSECLLLLPKDLIPDFILYKSGILRASIAESN
ncbi:lytic transglycosylase domain-containing protein [Danxiaibacter flavus]|uniref:Lytic transglycosylase domain-containing protein n=1 Tax=Danxiaibacter flavus TaxID=3049108 RepID=A0ABV3ZCQ7_9BACT|nr:lytic transglycosylase domain-containing protein [Chitinophagaceae bacterium DXS]